jgi:ribosomal protein S27AE
MADPNAPAARLICGKCQQELVRGKVTVSYLGNSFPVELLKCPDCGMAYVPEELAIGKMLQVEQALEDK